MLSINMGLVWTIINLIVLFLLLRHFLINPVSNIMEQRRKLIADGLQNAQDTQDEANRLKAEYEEALSGAKKESAEIVDKARIDARAEYDRIVGEAGAKAGNIIENAKENVRIEREQTMKELQSQIAGLAIASAEKIVGDKEQNIYDQFLGEVGGTDEDTDKQKSDLLPCGSSADMHGCCMKSMSRQKPCRRHERSSSEVPQLHDIFVNPTIDLKKKMTVIDKVFPEEIRNFLKVVCKYQRMDLIEDIFAAYDRYCDEQNQVLNAVLTCTVPPSEEQKKGMEAFLCKKYGAKKAKIEVCQDQALLGGFILRVGSDEYDWSMKGRLNRLEQRLTWR